MTDTPSLRQLRYFVALSETKHFRKAAERMGISQPSLSLQIGNLEQVLRLPLVERGSGGSALTPAGREVLARARRVLDEVADIVALAETVKDGMLGTIRLGSSPTLGPYILPKVVRRLHEQFPDLKLFIRDAAPRDLQVELLDGVHDVILTQLPVSSSDVVTQRLFREPLKLAVAPDHPLAARSAATDPDLEGQDVLTLGTAFTLHSQIAALCTDVNARLRGDYEGTSLDALRQMTAMNMGIAFLPALYVASEVSDTDPDVHILDFRRGTFTRSIGLVWRKSSGNQGSFHRLARIVSDVVAAEFRGEVAREMEAPQGPR